jgi:predicted DNA-binding antitoxin AbrB/MazE fold protein
MEQIITAVYERGVLQPLVKLRLNEGETVRLWILESEEGAEQNEARHALHALMAAGLVRPTLPRPDVQPVSEKRRRELARALAAGGPLSELIIEDRD